MNYLNIAFISIFFYCLSFDALAFESCNKVSVNPNKILDEIKLRIPVKHYGMFKEIELITNATENIVIPFASTTNGGRKTIVVPYQFAKLACQLSLSTYIKIKEGRNLKGFEEAARDTSGCLSDKKTTGECIISYGNKLANLYERKYSNLSQRHQRVAYGLYLQAVYQIVMHEYAHHFLFHFERIGNDIERIDAEFEADFFAIFNGIQSGEVAISMYYFFYSMAKLERHTNILSTNKYESTSCRLNNITSISEFIGIKPALLLDATHGGKYRFKSNSPESLKSMAKEMLSEGPTYDSSGCGKLSGDILKSSYKELKELVLRVSLDSEWLFEEHFRSKASYEALISLVRDLIRFTTEFKYMNTVAAKAASYLVRRMEIKGDKLTESSSEIEVLMNTKEFNENILSGDAGRLFQIQGLSVLQSGYGLNRDERIEKAQEHFELATFYNPYLSDSWMNLAFVRFMQGRCSEAKRLMMRSLKASTSDDEHKKNLLIFAIKMGKLSSNRESCNSEGDNFRPYSGL